MIHLCLDLDVLIAFVIGVAKGKPNTIPSRLLSACLDGRFSLVVSERMLWQLSEALMVEPLNLSLKASK